MSERVLISHAPGADVASLVKALENAGAATVEPIAVLPDTLLATVDGDEVDAFVDHARALPGVRHAERDRMRYTS
jgi:predicted ATPase